MKFVSLFTGIGGLDLGFERAGMECVLQVENDKACGKILDTRWPHTLRLDDISTVAAEEIPQADLYCGGFPCQDVSVAGRRAGLNGHRSRLFFEYLRLVASNHPRWIVVENVPGLLSSHKGRDMGAVVGAMEELGYGVAWRVLDAQGFGVPQRRRRLLFIGCRGSLQGAAEVLFDPASLRRNPQTIKKAEQEVASTLGGGSGSRGWAADVERMTFVPEIAATLEASTPGHRRRSEQGHLLPIAFHMTQDPISGEISPALGATSLGMGVLSRHIAPSLMAKAQRNDPDEEVFVISRQRLRVRRLMPVECERLQGFPDGWTSMVADSHRYRTLGNAVAVPVAHWLGIRILAAEARRKTRAFARKQR